MKQLSMTLAALVLCASSGAASAEVRFGRNVFIGGHNFSHQTYNRHRRAVITLYDRPIRHAGCAWRADRHGGRTKLCRLRRIPR